MCGLRRCSISFFKRSVNGLLLTSLPTVFRKSFTYELALLRRFTFDFVVAFFSKVYCFVYIPWFALKRYLLHSLNQRARAPFPILDLVISCLNWKKDHLERFLEPAVIYDRIKRNRAVYKRKFAIIFYFLLQVGNFVKLFFFFVPVILKRKRVYKTRFAKSMYLNFFFSTVINLHDVEHY